MKRFTKAVKMATAMLSLCLVCAVGVKADAAKYQPNVTYINPQVNTATDTYFSTEKMRMGTYTDETITVIYPKDGQISVSTNKPKKFQAVITEKSNENILNNSEYPNSKKVYVTPTKVYCRYYVWLPNATNTGFDKKQVWLEEATGRYYYNESVYDSATGYYTAQKMYIASTPDITEPTGAWYVNAMGEEDYTDSKDNVGFFYYDYNGSSYDNTQKETYIDGVTPDYEYAIAEIQLTSKKKGTYKVNVVVNGVQTTLKVNVTTNPYSTFTKAKLDGTTLMSKTVKSSAKKYSESYSENYQVKKSVTDGKLKFTANKGVKITGMVVATVDKNGKPVYKKYKNGSKIKLSQVYASESRSASNNGKWSRSSVKNTYVFLSYKDTFTKTSYKYSVVKKHGVKMIKEVRKAADGKKYINFYEYTDAYNAADVTLWSY